MKVKNLVIVMILAIYPFIIAGCGCVKFNKKKSVKEGFVPLFNGKDLAGWITGPDNMVSRLPKWTSISGQKPIRIRTELEISSNEH
ncbi:MAG TPA: hypothetical protein HPP66_07215 [Planctomycetes bacterium]|nr:hypothetical protein [Planctomycetota bacterium]